MRSTILFGFLVVLGVSDVFLRYDFLLKWVCALVVFSDEISFFVWGFTGFLL